MKGLELHLLRVALVLVGHLLQVARLLVALGDRLAPRAVLRLQAAAPLVERRLELLLFRRNKARNA